MEILLIRKFKKAFGIIIVIGIICCALIIGIIILGGLHSAMNSQISGSEEKLIVYKKSLGSSPEDAVELKQVLNKQLINDYENIQKQFKPTSPIASTPLLFKESLFRIQEELKLKAFNKKMVIPGNLGFDEYKVKVPDAAVADVLTHELSVVEELINMALDSGISAVDSIKLSHQNFSMVLGGREFGYFPVSLALKSDSGSIKAFLMSLSKSSGVFAVQQLKVKSLDQNENLLTTDITLKFIEI